MNDIVTQKPSFVPNIIFTDIRSLPQNEQHEKLVTFRELVRAESRKQNYPNKWRDYHYTVINNRVVNMTAMIAQTLALPEISSSPYIIMGMDWHGFFLYASVSEDTIREWKRNV